jgi:ketosteroid isomerase-like protein
MSSENVELVREVIELFGNVIDGGVIEGDASERLSELFADDVHIDMSRRVFNPDVYDGHEGLRRLVREMQEVWEEFRITPERFVDAGDRVVVIETRRGRGRTSGAAVEQRAGVIWTLRGGRIAGMETDFDPATVLETVAARG